ncbi:hypothetical protein DFQ03_0162 [Maribacter caenipelagi]|uniref:Uncharacterized protein n=1 Tax=Maribacter caenipelagi TaxID=1447781 RepID=A0A4R7DJ83_9FLAO|nr:hypothetical protein [Maribacter caenipelagi]TDS20655.1 hypothetical protein DFQ03_0162 [Maribacter caenipelagi]
MITEDKSIDKSRTTGGLQNDVPQNKGISQNEDLNEAIGEPVNNGGVATAKYDLHLEKQWLAVRDEYLSNFPETQDIDSNGEQNSVEALISTIAKRRQKSEQEIHDEIMNWTVNK